MTKGKKIAAAIAAAAIATITSVTAFADYTMNYKYDLKAGETVTEKEFPTRGTKLSFNTRPDGPGNVTVTVSGSALNNQPRSHDFPAQVDISDWVLTVKEDSTFDFSVKANLTSAAGTLYIKSY